MSRNDWSGLPYFLAVAREGSLRAAAEKLGATHTTVERNISALEASYGTVLFKRSQRGYALTDAGTAMLPRAKAAEAEVLAARRRVMGSDRKASGTVRFATSNWIAAYFIAPKLEKFSQSYPEIDLQITTTDRFQDMSKEEIDVSLRVAFDVDQDVMARRLFSYDVTVVASQQYLDRHWRNAGPEGEGLHWIGFHGRAWDKFWIDADLFPKAERRYAVDEWTLWGNLVSRNLGMAINPAFIRHVYPNIVQVPGTPVKPDRSLWILFHSDFKHTKRVRAVVDFFADEMLAQRAMFQI